MTLTGTSAFSSVFSTLRFYALSRNNIPLSILVGMVSFVPFALDLVSHHIRSNFR